MIPVNQFGVIKLVLLDALGCVALGHLVLLGPAAPLVAQSAADTPAGTWRLDDGHYTVHVGPRPDGTWHGRIVAVGAGGLLHDSKNPNEKLRGRAVVGTDLFWNLKWNATERKFTDGRLYSPEYGREVSASAWLDGRNTLHVQGRLMMMTRTRTFTRVAN